MVLAWEHTDLHSYDHLKCCYMLYLAFKEMLLSLEVCKRPSLKDAWVEGGVGLAVCKLWLLFEKMRAEFCRVVEDRAQTRAERGCIASFSLLHLQMG